MKSTLVLLNVFALVPGCNSDGKSGSSGRGSGGTNSPRWHISANPPDLTSEVGESPVAIVFRDLLDSRFPSQETLEQVAASAQVFKSDGPVPINATVVIPRVLTPEELEAGVEPPEGAAGLARVEIDPVDRWSNEWHTVRISPVPTNARFEGFRLAPGGMRADSIEFRLHPNRMATYQSVRLCAPKTSPTTLTVVLSEPPNSRELAAQSLVLTADGDPCVLSTIPLEESARWITLACKADAVPNDVTLTVSTPLITSDSMPFVTIAGSATFELRWPGDNWVREAGDVCYLWQF